MRGMANIEYSLVEARYANRGGVSDNESGTVSAGPVKMEDDLFPNVKL